MIVNLAAARLDNKDIFASNRLLDLNTSLSYCELSEENFCGWYAELVADSLDELRVRTAAQHNHVADHCEVGALARRVVKCRRKKKRFRDVNSLFQGVSSPRLKEDEAGLLKECLVRRVVS